MSHPPAGEEEDRPLVVLYLYFHVESEQIDYPNTRARDSETLAVRYLECALAQTATLRLQDANCDVAFVSNLRQDWDQPRRMRTLLARLESFDVRMLHAGYTHRPGGADPAYVASRYLFDAILAAAEAEGARHMWFLDLDCVWVDARKVFAASPGDDAVGCLVIDYPPEWNTVGSERHGSRREIQQLATEMGPAAGLPPWVGGELITGTTTALRALVDEAQRAESALTAQGVHLATEEQLLTLLAAQGAVSFVDLSRVARRIQTGRRHDALSVTDAQNLGLWHLPAEKGLSLRRAANDVLDGHEDSLRRDLADPARAAARFKVGAPSLGREVRDLGWIVKERLRQRLRRPGR